jgi:ketosteroid isomerase-like protein
LTVRARSGILALMSRENVEVVRQFIEAARSGDDDVIEAFVAVSDPSIEHTRLPAASGPEMYFGHDGVRRWFTDMADIWREWRNEIEELAEVGADTVAARVRFSGVGRDSGVPVEARLGLVCVLSVGKILRSRTSASGEAALEAVGAGKSDSRAGE